MNSLLVISEHGWWIAGWTMVYFLAIGSVVTIVAGVLRFMMRGATPMLRYAASLVVLAILAVLPAGIAVWLCQSPPGALVTPEIPSPTRVVDLAVEPIKPPTPNPTTSPQETLPLDASPGFVGPTAWTADRVIRQLPWLWLIGTPLTFLLLATGLIGAERLRRSSTILADGPLHAAAERLRLALGLGRKVAIAVCDRVATPLLVGIVRPLILLPPVAVTGWAPDDLEMVLLHELAHVKRWDNLVNLVQRIVESALFFHPAVWLVSHWVRVDREDCCDAVVVARTAKPQAYAELLVSLAGAREPLAGLALSRHPLRGRIRRILRLPDEPMRVSRGTLVAVGTALLAVVVGFSSYHPQASTAEDVADPTTDERSDLDSELAERKERMERVKEYEERYRRQIELVTEQTKDKLEATKDELQAVETELAQARITLAEMKLKMDVTKHIQSARQANPDLLQPGDVVHLEVKGQPPGIPPLWDDHPIESMGTIALGPTYGRVKIAGHDLLEAEKLITEHLSKILEKPVVQLTLKEKGSQPLSNRPLPPFSPTPPKPGSSDRYAPSAPTPGSKESQVLYDGKTFDEWRDQWKTELKTENRIECIKALAAFGRAGYGKQAVEAILDVAAQYDFSLINEGPEGKLKETILKLFQADAAMGLSNKELASMVLDRLEQGSPNLRSLGRRLLESIRIEDEDTWNRVLAIAQDGGNPLSGSASVGLIYNDRDLSRPETLKLVHRALQQDSPNMAVLSILYYRHLDLVPEQLTLLFHQDPLVRYLARHWLPTGNESLTHLVDYLLTILSDPAQSDKHADAILALKATATSINAPDKKRVVSRLEEIVRTGDEQLLAPALATLGEFLAQVSIQSIQRAIKGGQVSEKRLQLLQDTATLEGQVNDLKKQEQRLRIQAFGGGGDGFGGGGGAF